jgi:hypothetical protein
VDHEENEEWGPFAYRSGNVLLMGWKDKRVVLMISTFHDTSTEKRVNIQNEVKKKLKNQCVCLTIQSIWVV